MQNTYIQPYLYSYLGKIIIILLIWFLLPNISLKFLPYNTKACAVSAVSYALASKTSCRVKHDVINMDTNWVLTMAHKFCHHIAWQKGYKPKEGERIWTLCESLMQPDGGLVRNQCWCFWWKSRVDSVICKVWSGSEIAGTCGVLRHSCW